MEFTGRIMKVLEPRSGISEKTGKEWKTQGFIFEYFENPTDRYSDKVYLETFDENIINQLQENLPVRVGFGHHVRELTNQQGRKMVLNEIRIYKFEPQVQQVQQQQQDGGSGAAPSATAPTTGTTPFPPQVDSNGNPINQAKDDDLPF